MILSFIFFTIVILLVYFLFKEDKARLLKNKHKNKAKNAEKEKVAFSREEESSSFRRLKKLRRSLKKTAKLKKVSLKSKIKAKNLKDIVVFTEIFRRP